MAQIIELLGDFPLEVKMGGKYSRELFDHTGRSPPLFLSTSCSCRSRRSALHPCIETVATKSRHDREISLLRDGLSGFVQVSSSNVDC